jgi:acyl carrier protein
MAPVWDDAFEAILRPRLRLHAHNAEIPPDLDMVAAGLDSQGIVELLYQVEDHYGISFLFEYASEHTFTTPGGMWDTIQRCREVAGKGPCP